MYSTKAKQAAYRAVARKLRQLAADLGLPAGSYQVRSCYGGIAVPGEAILHGQTVYVCCPLFMDGCSKPYFRTCKGMTDYTGGRNYHSTRQVPTVEEVRYALNNNGR